ncbi:MAG: hypothetical protein ACOX9E_13025 [Lentisphaeria bacterium]|jgi:hypothetical protein
MAISRQAPGSGNSLIVFYPQIAPIVADYFQGGLLGAGKACVFAFPVRFFYPQITQIFADFWRRVSHCRCAALPSHAAGFFADWGRFPLIMGVSREVAEDFYPQIAPIIADYFQAGLFGVGKTWVFALPVRFFYPQIAPIEADSRRLWVSHAKSRRCASRSLRRRPASPLSPMRPMLFT